MRFGTFHPTDFDEYSLVYLVPAIRIQEMEKAYLDPFQIPKTDALAIELHTTGKKTPKAEMKRWVLEDLIPQLELTNPLYIMVADAEYFKLLSGQAKADASLGYVLDCAFGPWKVAYIPNFKAAFYDPVGVKAKIQQATMAVLNHAEDTYQDPGSNIIHFEEYPSTVQEISAWLDHLLEMNVPLAIDIEAFSLKPTKAGIGTISFAWSKHEGIAFAVDWMPSKDITMFGEQGYNREVRALLKDFFKNYLQKQIYHNISYDVTVLIYQLFMEDVCNREGLLEGLDVFLKNWDDTKLISYLATNSCAGNHLSLKEQAQEYAGNYAQSEIADIRMIDLPSLLKYNLIDSLATWFVYEKNNPKMIHDQQEEIYTTVFKPALVDIVDMQLTGLPLNMARVKEVKVILKQDEQNALDAVMQSEVVQLYVYQMREAWVIDKNSKLKKKRVSLLDAGHIVFNPNSGDQLRGLLYDMMKLPVLATTDSKLPSTDRDTLKALRNHTTDPDMLNFLNGMLAYGAVNKILTSFIPAMEEAPQGSDGWHYLMGFFNLGGTVSGRLSSSGPNLQNLPSSGSPYAKIFKSCFSPPPGWLFCGLDFASLEDRISALTTKDPNKLRVYLEGYDGHSLRAFTYFGEQMPDIVNTVESINSIEHKYKPLRQESKAPTFALTYQGTYITLMKNCGFSEEKARMVEARYHELYKVSDQWVQAKLDEAGKTGYVTAAFGLRVRTPLLAQVIRGTRVTPYEAEAEGRTAGNALGQSWCLLNSRAGSEFMGKARVSEYRLDIRPCAQIHDAQYFLVRDNIDAVAYTNKHLVQAVRWQDHPDIWHDEVKLGGNLGIFWPDWSKEATIPNDCSTEEIRAAFEKHVLSIIEPKENQ